MSKLLGILLMGAGLALAIGEVALWRLSGAPIGEYVLFDREGSAGETSLAIKEGDLPIRFDLDLEGWRENSGTTQVEVTLELVGDAGRVAGTRVSESIRRQRDLAGFKQAPAELRRGPALIYNRETTHALLTDAPAGKWELVASVNSERRYVPDRIVATAHANARELDWRLLGGGILLVALGIVATAIVSRARS